MGCQDQQIGKWLVKTVHVWRVERVPLLVRAAAR